MKINIPLSAARAQLSAEPAQLFTTLMRHGSMSVEYYKPERVDLQMPHQQDEIYVVISGSGIYYCNGERVSFATHDVLFAPAGAEHRFENFTTDFATWVIFYGPVGGEQQV